MCSKEVTEFIKKSHEIRRNTREGYILFIDDEKHITDIFKRLSIIYNFSALCVNGIKAGLNTIIKDQENIKCIVIDLHLEHGNGEEIIKHIEENRINIPYIVYSGDNKEINKIQDKYPRAMCFKKSDSIYDLIEFLGIEI
jgi:DNA-binding NtrC family response regulator